MKKALLGAPRVVALALGALLAACSSPAPPRFHSLLAAPGSVRAVASPVQVAWQLLPVSIPAQVDQPQFVVRRADDTFTVLEQERWVAPLNEEVRAALAEQLTGVLGPAGSAPAAGGKDWRIHVDVQRFDSTPGRTMLVAQWALLANGDRPALRCRSVLEQAVGAGMPALAGGHRAALAQLGTAISQALAALDAGRSTTCS